MLQLALDASVCETVVTEISFNNRLQTIAPIDEVLVSKHSTVNQEQESFTSSINFLREASNL